ncbi:dCTP pyrophosphatase 1-like [Sesbania bispinosa]|nr:dCTP pyrophosphatase 1-like [Sesbania bispinosa]
MTGTPEEVPVTLDLLKQKMSEFAKERDWDQFHSPRNLLWLWWVKWENYLRYFSGKERLSDICGVDLGKAALRKVQLNAIKYPVKVYEDPPTNNQEDQSITNVPTPMNN